MPLWNRLLSEEGLETLPEQVRVVWDILLHCVNTHRCDWLNKEAGWPTAGQDKVGGKLNRECWEGEGWRQRSCQQTQGKAR